MIAVGTGIRWPGLAVTVALACSGGRARAGDGCADPPWREALGYRSDEVHAIGLDEAHGFPLVPVEIEGETFRLVFDTGDMVGIVLPEDTILRLGLRRTATVTQLNGSGRRVGDMGVFEAPGVTLLGDVLHDVPVYAGSSRPGLVGPGQLPGSRFTLDHRCRALAVSRSSAPKSAGWLPLLPSEHPRLVLVPGTVNGEPVVIEIDTGKSRTVVDPGLADRLGLPAVRGGHRIDRLEVGGRSYRIGSARRSGLSGIESSIGVGIGADLLRDLVLTVDYSGGRVRLDAARR